MYVRKQPAREPCPSTCPLPCPGMYVRQQPARERHSFSVAQGQAEQAFFQHYAAREAVRADGSPLRQGPALDEYLLWRWLDEEWRKWVGGREGGQGGGGGRCPPCMAPEQPLTGLYTTTPHQAGQVVIDARGGTLQDPGSWIQRTGPAALECDE